MKAPWLREAARAKGGEKDTTFDYQVDPSSGYHARFKNEHSSALNFNTNPMPASTSSPPSQIEFDNGRVRGHRPALPGTQANDR